MGRLLETVRVIVISLTVFSYFATTLF